MRYFLVGILILNSILFHGQLNTSGYNPIKDSVTNYFSHISFSGEKKAKRNREVNYLLSWLNKDSSGLVLICEGISSEILLNKYFNGKRMPIVDNRNLLLSIKDSKEYYESLIKLKDQNELQLLYVPFETNLKASLASVYLLFPWDSSQRNLKTFPKVIENTFTNNDYRYPYLNGFFPKDFDTLDVYNYLLNVKRSIADNKQLYQNFFSDNFIGLTNLINSIISTIESYKTQPKNSLINHLISQKLKSFAYKAKNRTHFVFLDEEIPSFEINTELQNTLRELNIQSRNVIIH